MLADLVRDGLATARLESLGTGERKIAVARVRITDAGQMALEGAATSE
jgi:ribosomal protein S9